MKSQIKYITIVLGVLLLALGVYWIKTVADPQGVMRALPYVCVGIGSVGGRLPAGLVFGRPSAVAPPCRAFRADDFVGGAALE